MVLYKILASGFYTPSIQYEIDICPDEISTTGIYFDSPYSEGNFSDIEGSIPGAFKVKVQFYEIVFLHIVDTVQVFRRKSSTLQFHSSILSSW